MSRQFKNGRCSCWQTIDRQLAKMGENTELAYAFTFDGHHYLQVKTEHVSSSRKSPKMVVAAYCPFCGNKLKEPKPHKETKC